MSLGRLVSTNVLVRSATRNATRFHPTFRTFAVHHVHTPKLRSSVIVGLGSTRSLSFWRSTPAPTPATSTPLSAPPPVPATSELLNDVPETEAIAETIPVPESTSFSEVIPSLDIPPALEILPLNYGDLAAIGFSQWTPAGIAQWSMELIQVASGMPWFWTIVTATVLSRLIILPFNVYSIRTAARLAPYQPRLTELREELQKIGDMSKDPVAIQRISLQQKLIYEEAGASYLAPFVTLVVQLPISLGLFFGVKRLCEFPLEQLKVGGYGWITDLTVSDPTYVLPLTMAALLSVQLSVNAKDIGQDAAQMLHVFNLLKAVSFVSIPLMAGFPAGVLVYMTTGIIAMTAQSLLLRAPSVRKVLNIPMMPNRVQVKPPTFLESAKAGIEWLGSKSTQPQASQQRAQTRKKF